MTVQVRAAVLDLLEQIEVALERDNQVELARLAAVHAKLEDTDSVNGRIRCARRLVSGSIRRIARTDRAAHHVATLLIVRLAALDQAFDDLGGASTLERLRLAAAPRPSKTHGRARVNERGTLAALMAKVGGFGATSVANARVRIDNAK